MIFNFNAFNETASHAVLRANRLTELLDELGFNYRGYSGGRTFRGPCPVHHGRRQNCQVDTVADHLPIRWSCWSKQCHKRYKPSLLGFVRGVLSSQFEEPATIWQARRWLESFIAKSVADEQVELPSRPQAPEWNPRKFTRSVVRDHLQIPSPYFVKRGFSPDVLDLMDVGHSSKLRKSIVPIYDRSGAICVSFAQRTELPMCGICEEHHKPGKKCQRWEPKWTFERGFPKSEYLYNHTAALGTSSATVVLTEGTGDVWAAVAGGVVAVASFGSGLIGKQGEMLAVLKKQILVIFDNDEAGCYGSKRTVVELRKLGAYADALPVPDEYHDLGEMPPTEVRKWLGPRCNPPRVNVY